MGEVVGQLMAPAVGVLLSPLPIVGVILMLLSAQARRNGPAFLAGWAGGLFVFTTVLAFVVGSADSSDSESAPSTTAGIIFLILALALWFLAYKQFSGRPKAGEDAEMPKWMAGIEKMTPVVALGMGAFLSTINPKNLIIDIGAATTIAQGNLSNGEVILAALIFTIVASLAIGGAVIWYLLAGEKATVTLDKLRIWLVANNAVIMAVLLLVLGFSMLGKAIPAFVD